MKQLKPKYPEHEKMAAVQSASGAIGEFLEWLQSRNITLCEYQAQWTNGQPYKIPYDPAKHQESDRCLFDSRNVYNPDYESSPEGFYPVRKSIETWLADFLNIDLKKIEEEKRAMLAAMRKANAD